jgi:hypothetical protein
MEPVGLALVAAVGLALVDLVLVGAALVELIRTCRACGVPTPRGVPRRLWACARYAR